MATTTNYSWTTPDDTALVKDGAAAIRTLGSSIDTTTKNLNPSTTLGDIEYRSSTANTNTRLAIGTTGQVLTVSGGVPAWQTASSGGMTLISETVASANSSLSLSSIPGTYKQLMLVWSGIYHSGTGSNFVIRFNNSSSTYWGSGLGSSSSSASAFGYNETSITKQIAGVDVSPFGTSANFSTTDVNAQANGVLIIDDYASTTKYKHFETSYGFYHNAATTYVSLKLNAANSDTAAITSIDVVRASGTATFTNRTNTSIRLYGIS